MGDKPTDKDYPPRTRPLAHWSDGNVDITGKPGPLPDPPEEPAADKEEEQ